MMRSFKAGVIVAVSVSASLALVAAVLNIVQENTSGRSARAATNDASSNRSLEVVGVEAAIARASLTSRLKTALGGSFGGVWFDSKTAQVYVGVTSVGGRKTTEAIASQFNLEGAITPTSVRSTWIELEFAQAQWDHRLADLFDQGKVTSALRASSNAVEIQLKPEVSMSRHMLIESQAAGDSTNLLLTTDPRPNGRVARGAQCGKFEKFLAFCDPTIVSGVRIEAGEGCTAGPLAISKDRSEEATATATYLLTAGHCIEKAGGEGVKWYSYDKDDTSKENKYEIGAAGPFVNSNTDVGVINVTTTHWATENDAVPTVPAVALWSAAKESEPAGIETQADPIEGTETCFSGQRSGQSCGTVEKLNTKETIEGELVENLTEVTLKSGTGGAGDSGSPFYAEAAPGVVYGTFVAYKYKGDTTEGETIWFHNLSESFKKLKEAKELDLELLTESNKVRHPTFTAAEYPVTISGKNGSAEDKFTVGSGVLTCKESELTGELTEPKTEEVKNTIELVPNYSGCADEKGRPGKMASNGCKYKFTLDERVAEDHYKALVSIVCPEGKPGIEFSVYADHATLKAEGISECSLVVPPQSGLKAVTLTNNGENIEIDKGTIEGMTMGVYRHGCECLGGTSSETTTSGVLHLGGAVSLTGSNGGEKVKVDMAGG